MAQYTLKNDGSRISDFVSSKSGKEIEEGMGIRYIKARLEESFPGQWEISYDNHNGFWEVNISIKC